MTKLLSLETNVFKFNDNNTDIKLRASDNGIYLKIKDDQVATLKIKSDVGYLKTLSLVNDNGVFVFSTNQIKDLPVGVYYIELWVTNGNSVNIYPDEKFMQLNIIDNVTQIKGDVISSITVQDFQNQFNDLSKEILDNLPEGKIGPQGEKGDTGAQGVQGIQGERGEQGEQGQQGIQGVAGKDFSIAETFPSVASMNGDGLTKGDFVIISSTVEDPDNAKLYLWDGTDFSFITDMSGATGIKGETGEQGIQGPQGIPGEQGKQGIQGVQGETGAAGKDGTDGKDGANGKDAVINVVTQAEYDALTDKSGVYFIGD